MFYTKSDWFGPIWVISGCFRPPLSKLLPPHDAPHSRTFSEIGNDKCTQFRKFNKTKELSVFST